MENLTPGNVAGYVALAVTVFGVFFEIAPIKFNPISMLLNWMGKRMNKELAAKVDKQGKDLDDFKEEMKKAMEENALKLTEHERAEDTYEINRMRHEILDFSNACQNHRMHTARQFAHIISLYTDYEKIISKWGLTNGQIDQEIQYIKELDMRCKREHTYLPEGEEARRS